MKFQEYIDKSKKPLNEGLTRDKELNVTILSDSIKVYFSNSDVAVKSKGSAWHLLDKLKEHGLDLKSAGNEKILNDVYVKFTKLDEKLKVTLTKRIETLGDTFFTIIEGILVEEAEKTQVEKNELIDDTIKKHT